MVESVSTSETSVNFYDIIGATSQETPVLRSNGSLTLTKELKRAVLCDYTNCTVCS
jgi:hypothetical protein